MEVETSEETETLPRTQSGVRAYDNDPALPPGYDEVIVSTRYPILRAASHVDPQGATSSTPDGDPESGASTAWRLKFVDFTPHLTGNTSRRNTSSFEKLLDRANVWLQSNKNVNVKTCETVTWCAEDFRRLNDTDVVTTTIKKGKIKRLHFMRGLRLWVTPRQESADESVTLGVREYTPDVFDLKSLETFDLKTLVRTANNKIWESPLSGDIISIETVMQPSKAEVTKEKLALRVKDTYWTDGAKVDRKYIPIIRVFYALGARNMNVEIGMTDMVPRVIRQNGRNRYEDMESLMVRASEWGVHQPHVTVTNLQTVAFKRRGFSQGVGFPVFWATTDSEEACIRCIRTAYTKPKTMVTLRVYRPHHYSIKKKTFAPRKSPLSITDSRDRQPDDLKYQSFTRTVDEISYWIDKNDVEVMNVETIRQQVSDGKYHSSPDSSLVRPSEEKSREFVTLVRVYLKVTNQSAASLSGAAALFNNPSDRPFWSRPSAGLVTRRKRARHWKNAMIILVVLTAIVIVAVVIVLVMAKAKGWI